MNCSSHPEYIALRQVNGIGFCKHCVNDGKAADAQKVASELADHRRRKGLCVQCGKRQLKKVKVCPNCGRGAGVEFRRLDELTKG